MNSSRPDSLQNPASSSRSSAGPLPRLPSVERVAVVALVLAVIGTSLVSGNPALIIGSALAGGTMVIAAQVWAGKQRRRLASWIQDANDSEIEGWRSRWQSLSLEAQQATTALSLMRDGVIMLSLDNKIMLVNSSARRLLALSPDQDLYEQSFGEYVRNPDISRAIMAARSGDGVQKIQIDVSDGESVRPLKIRVTQFSTVGQSNLLVTIRDETEARQVDEMRREFVANISHELKTPLAAIKGYAETVELAIKDDPDTALHFLSQIESQCLRLERLTSDMMQLARAQAGRSNLKIVSVNLNDVITESLKSYDPVAEAKNIDLSVSRPDYSATVLSDSEATLTIANNLIGNAIHYTPEGGKVNVSYRQAGNFYALVVEDTGVGISETDQKRIFERFYRVKGGRGAADGGTGIGLSIVKNLTQTLGGEVRLASQPGSGSRFEVLLPKAELDDAEDGERRKMVTGAETQQA